MSILRDLYCPGCDAFLEDIFVDGENFPMCKNCAQPMRNAITKINTDSWGAPQYHPALDMTFASKSDLRTYMKSKNLMEAGDKVGGARNEEYLGLGKRFGYAGKRDRSGSDYAQSNRERVVSPDWRKA